jgi:hypothetical protein
MQKKANSITAKITKKSPSIVFKLGDVVLVPLDAVDVCSGFALAAPGFAPHGSLYEFVLYNSYKIMYELVQKPHLVRIQTTQFV